MGWGLNNEQHSFIYPVGEVKKETTQFTDITFTGQDYQLGEDSRRDTEYPNQNVYDVLSEECTECKEEKTSFDWALVPTIESSGTIIEQPVKGWKPPSKSSHDCECGKNCLCAPYVCEKKHCNHNYAVVFGAKWCRYCYRMKPIIKELKRRDYIVFYIDTDEFPSVIERFELRKWPTTIVMDKKKPVIKFSGLTSYRQLSEHLKTRKQQGLPPEKEE